MKTGSTCMNGTLEQTLLRHICWCPPKGICQAGNAKKMMPSGFRYIFSLSKNASFPSGSICSMTSCMRMMSKSPSFSKGLVFKKSAQANSPSVSSVAKNILALSILPAARSSPETLHPACAKGRRLPPSPHPISRTLQPGPMFLYGFR